MGIKRFRPTTPSLRWTLGYDFREITKDKPKKSLLQPLRKKGGRNTLGRITARHRGGGHKRMYRLIDFRRSKVDAAARVKAIEYDPNRSARIALLEYSDGGCAYILAPLGLNVGDELRSKKDEAAEIKVGNHLPLRYIPLGMPIHNVELVKGKGGQIVRAAGSYAEIMAKEGKFAQVRLPSGEVRLIGLDCCATLGQIGNMEHKDISIGKAGRTRWLGRRPRVRGSAMNPVDHPHGGGEGKSGQGNPHPVSPEGLPTKGFKTRKKHKYSDKFIVKRR